MLKLLKNRLNNKLVVGCIGSNSTLAKELIKQYNNRIIFKIYKGKIENIKLIENWLLNNKNINILINFAAITSVYNCEKNKKKALKVNCFSVIKLLETLNKIKMTNFEYFLAISTSHVFKKSLFKLKESSEKKPYNYYGFSKLLLEKYILRNYKKFYFKIGIARIFNYYNKNSKKGFFINDTINKFKKKTKTIKFKNINTYRDYVSIKDISKAIYRMINCKMILDFNICSGKKIFLPNIIKKIQKKYKNKIVIFNKKRVKDLVGSNIKFKRAGWKVSKYNVLNDL